MLLSNCVSAASLLLISSLCLAEQFSQEEEVPKGPVFRPHPQIPPPPASDPDLLVVPRLGVVRGRVGYKNIRNRPISAFLGLKYGVVRAGLGRFQPAVVAEQNNNDVIDATREPSNCPQISDLQNISIAEARDEVVDDCLTVNIFTPNTRGSYPVMVYIHGEMLFDGSAGEAQPEILLEHDVVLVSVNYRLAPFGFLTTLSDEMPGNVALADIQMALEWVQLYIRPFGGNADEVTLFGQAGGATLVHALSSSGKAHGLFKKLILQSGTALNPYFWDEDPLATIKSFARYARCPLSSGQRVLQNLASCFKGLSTTQLLTTFKRHWLDNELRGLRFTGGFKLVVGDKLGYITEPPGALVSKNAFPMIIGVTKDAGAVVMSKIYDQLSHIQTREISDYINLVLRHTAQPKHYIAWRKLALEQIFSTEDAVNPTLDKLAQGLLELVNLILYRAPVIDSIRYTSSKFATFLYCFDYRGAYYSFGHLKNPFPFAPDAALGDDMVYLFPYPVEVSQLNERDKAMSHAMTSMWYNFAKYGKPNLNASVWPNVSNEFGPFLRFSNSNETPLELDSHFTEGIVPPNLYPHYFRPSHPGNHLKPQTPQAHPVLPFKAHETVLNGPGMSLP